MKNKKRGHAPCGACPLFSACGRGAVSRILCRFVLADEAAAVISLGTGLLRASCGLPEGPDRGDRRGAAPVSRSSHPPIWPCSGGRLPARRVATTAVRSYPARISLTAPARVG